MTKAEEIIAEYYNSKGWESVDGVADDTLSHEDLRACAQKYAIKSRLRVMRHVPTEGEYMLDMASGNIPYPEYILYSKGYKKRYCVDLSEKALEGAKEKIGDHGEYLHGSFLKLPLEENFFDCVISLHTLYHVDEDEQAEVVRKFLSCAKKGKPVIIVYSSEENLITKFKRSLLARIYRRLKYIILNKKASGNTKEIFELYFRTHPLSWWDQFKDEAEIEILPWRSFGNVVQEELFPNNALGTMMFNVLFALEETFPKFFVRNFQYPMIILKKK